MKKEISFGAVLYRKEKEKICYLLLQHNKNYFNFPKGHPEKGEGPLEAAKREIFEETGIKDLRIIDGFEEKNNYFFKQNKKGIFKTAIFFLAETKEKRVIISKEHTGYKWLCYKNALNVLRFKDLKNIIEKANNFLLEKKEVNCK